MRSFLKAISPGPCNPCFWIGVRISLFQKQVCSDHQQMWEYEEQWPYVLHGAMPAVWIIVSKGRFDTTSKYHRMSSCLGISSAKICSCIVYLGCPKFQRSYLVTWRLTYKSRKRTDLHPRIEQDCIALQRGFVMAFQTDTICRHSYEESMSKVRRYYISSTYLSSKVALAVLVLRSLILCASSSYTKWYLCQAGLKKQHNNHWRWCGSK